ncbi:M16 family metallopeptidase [Sneathiella limimaris]|uniref:M16 family metallopeptidase n=1 Tax=Sneathiella limimaris TaxID=1964213 RepID=UPI00146B1193|nr:pitrilysin family protein [Sneathiella limimaris]
MLRTGVATRLLFGLIFGLYISTAAQANIDIPKLFDPKTTTLENGMQVVVIEDDRAPVVTHMVWYKIGAADEPRGKAGIAHFLEHLMFKGTDKYGPGEFSRIVAELGGQDNAFTSQDYTAYYQRANVMHLPLLMEMEADRMQGLKLNDEVVGAELQVILEERSQRTDNNPGAQFGEQLDAAQYLAHPYGTPVIGWRHEMEGLTTQDAIDWYKTYYSPNNAILIVAGHVKAEEVFELAKRYYGPKVPQSLPKRERIQEPPQLAKRTLEMRDKRVREPSWRQSFMAPVARTGDLKEVRALEVLDEILSGGTTSRLYSELVRKQKVAAGAGCYYDSGSYDPSIFVFWAAPVNGSSLQDVEKAVWNVINDVLEKGVTESELSEAKDRMLAAAIYARDDLNGAANLFGRALTSGVKMQDIVNWPEQISKVTQEDILRAARKVFDERTSVVGKLMPEEK